jgi:uncharacterized damage-inducible protein DinB
MVQSAAPSRDQQIDPRLPEKELLKAFLDWYREGIMLKVNGLTREEATRRLVPTPTNLLGVVKHLAYVEQGWFQRRFMGRTLPVPWSKEDPDADFRIEADETVDGVVAFYRDAIAESDRIIATSRLDDEDRRAGDDRATLRWILVHMIEETARHAGHCDILRELTDGVVGE